MSQSAFDNSQPIQANKTELVVRLSEYVGELIGVQPDTIDTNIPFEQFGLDSSAIVAMTGELETWLSIELDPSVGYDYPTLDALIDYAIDLSNGTSDN